MSIFLARWLAVDEFGAYSIGFAVLLFFYQIHFSFMVDPMGVLGPAYYSEILPNYLIAQIRLHFVLFGPLGLILALIAFGVRQFLFDTLTIRILTTMALTLPFLLLPWLLRRVFYVLAKTEIAIQGSIIYAIILITGLIISYSAKVISAEIGIYLVALAGLISSIYMYWRLLGWRKGKHIPPLKEIFSHSWQFGKWLIPASLLLMFASQAQIFISGSVLGLEKAGAVNALQMFNQPMILVISAIIAFGTPLLSSDYSNGNFNNFRHKVFYLSLVLSFFALIYGLALFLFRTQIENILYSGKFSAYVELIPIWGTIPFILALTSGMQAAFQSARKPYAFLIGAMVWAPVSIGLGMWFATKWNILGLSISVLIGYSVLATVFGILYWIWMAKGENSDEM